MIVKYETTVKSIGPVVQEFIEAGILVFFGMNAPEELRELAILHEHTILHQDVVTGDILVINEQEFPVLCVGDVANENLSNLGHFVVKFNGLTEPEMPGDISVPADAQMPPVTPGTIVKFVSQD